MPKNGTPGGVNGVSGLNCHFASPTTMSTMNGAMMSTENTVELSATSFTPKTLTRVNTAMIAQQIT